MCVLGTYNYGCVLAVSHFGSKAADPGFLPGLCKRLSLGPAAAAG